MFKPSLWTALAFLFCVVATLSQPTFPEGATSDTMHHTSSIEESTTHPAMTSPPPTNGGQVSAVSVFIAEADRIPGSPGKAVTVHFTTATALPAGAGVTITLPMGYISGSIGAVGTNFMETTSGTAPQYVVFTIAAVAAGPQTIVLTGATIGGPMAATPTGVTIATATDLAASGPTVALGNSAASDVSQQSAHSPSSTGICIPIPSALNATLCSGQAAYFITELTPIFCPQGPWTFAPMGVTMVGMVTCPVPFPSTLPVEACRAKPVPSGCSPASQKIAQVPGVCETNKYFSFMGFDSIGCPNLSPPPSTNSSSNGGSVCHVLPAGLSHQGCSPQATYFITALSSLYCPLGQIFSPMGVTVTGTAMCPNPASAAGSPSNCKSLPVPAGCSEESFAWANIPDYCGPTATMYAGFLGFDSNNCPVVPTRIQRPPTGGQGSPPPSNSLQLSFAVSHLCPFGSVTRSCLLRQSSFPTVIMAQCSTLPTGATSATRAVCAHVFSSEVQASMLPSYFDSLATLLSSDLDHFQVCLEKKPSMKLLLHAISRTDSHDPRDPTATATNLLNLCFSSCAASSTATLLAVSADSVRRRQSSSPQGPTIISSFCTNPLMSLLWQHAINSPRECSDSMISIVSAELSMTPCEIRSILPTYVAMCDAKAIQCEETFLAATSTESPPCASLLGPNGPNGPNGLNGPNRQNATCSSECAALAHKFSSGSKCMESMYSNEQVLAYVVNETCSDSVGLVSFYSSRRNDYRMIATALNAHCNLSTPFPSDLPDAKGLFDAAALVSFSQPAAFVVASQDSRVELREFTHSPTFVFRAAFNFTFNVSDLHMFSSVPGGDSMILQSVSDSIMDALQDVLGSRNDTVFVVSGEEYYSYDSVSLPTKKVYERSGYVTALNSSGKIRHPYDQPFDSFFADQVNLNHLTNLAINIFHQKMPYNPTMRNLVSSESLQIFLFNSSTIPAVHQNAPSAFEFSAAPLLLQRILPMPTRPQLEALGFLRPGTPPASPFIPQTAQCRIDSVGPFKAGTLYAGDGVVIQRPLMSTLPCVSTLRYPRSSFAYGNMTFLWSRVESPNAPLNPLFRPNGRSAEWQNADNEHNGSPYIVEYGHITINVSSDGSIIHNLPSTNIQVNDEEVVLHIMLPLPMGQNFEHPITLYAVRRLKIDLSAPNAGYSLPSMEPNVYRGFPASSVFFANKSAPVDFSCTELDLSSMTSGTRAVLSVVSSGVDMSSSMMTYYTPGYNLGPAVPPSSAAPVPLCSLTNQSLPQCSDYYKLALHRQHTDSSQFREFPTELGRAFLISNPGYYIGCVSAQEYHVPGNARLQKLDGVVTARTQKKDVKDMKTCSSGPAASTFPNGGQA